MGVDEPCFDDRDELILALRDAVELEMSLMLQYIYAAYSIPSYETGARYVDAGLWTRELHRFLCGDGEHRLDRGVRGEILQVANEEMIHFLLVNNLLMAVGGHFYVATPEFGGAARRFGIPVDNRLEPLTLACLSRFVAFEAPADPAVIDLSQGRGSERAYSSVSALYRLIRNTFSAHPEFIMVRPGETGGEHHLFLPRKTNKYHPDFQCQVDDLASALFALQTLTEQGEGGEPTDEGFESSHWRRFRRMRDELERFEGAGCTPLCYPCVTNPSERSRLGAAPITNEQTLEVLRLFNASFAISMQLMLQHFCLNPRGTLRRSRLMNASIDVMAYMMAPLGVLLMGLDSGIPGKTAGPSFELPYPLQFIPDHAVAQRHLSHKFEELATAAAKNPVVPRDVTDLLRQYAGYTTTLS